MFRRTLNRTVFALCLLPVACAILSSGCDKPLAREVVVVARGMTFVLAEDPESPNPVIRMRAGERIRLVFRNEAPGLIHNFEIPAWDVRTDEIRAGQITAVSFTVPNTPGRYEYRCRPHAELMHGFVEVSPT